MPQKPMRLPPLKGLRVRAPLDKKTESPCVAMMSSLLACWASAGFNTSGCAALENALRTCMDSPPPQDTPRNTINFHLARMYDRVILSGRRKR
ncbi:37S ribosomal protein MRP10 like [Verticillium longisporum]|uniref:Small ribosomal subunit protein mS37 n=5 Tax=Verticillium TaxID=1036719 RepID=G2X0J4_VERDV|nr:uncharacterized protein VDAG_03773 [Verticillium dahliae VdLs.17]KAF3343834.1 40S ribosomal protein S21 [Verticillium dahliae VDG2]KAG7122887.1 37S ribosomal protein MRP10 like [Verticillium longisporum]KAH6678988.1 hypothetical protein EV126DRAFT_527051 [Verticillium dahliae]EGY22335.1 hypothetical protein VDAG_03773 [Verticillium dahliae VdLs.17]KAG7133093.1 37S ribosomal protein MRP10 like [Verticillium longisporum]